MTFATLMSGAGSERHEKSWDLQATVFFIVWERLNCTFNCFDIYLFYMNARFS